MANVFYQISSKCGLKEGYQIESRNSNDGLIAI